jgi:hypothetical protein
LKYLITKHKVENGETVVTKEDDPSNVYLLDEDSYQAALKDEAPYAIMWCVSTHANCKEAIPSFTNSSIVLEESGIKFGRMDVEDYADIGKEVGIDRLPYLRFYP